MKWKNTLLSFDEDIKERSLIDWFKAHISGFKPLHKYEGILELLEEKLVYAGKDIKDGKELKLEIKLKDIIDVYLGFDEIFKGREERAWPWNKPLRIKFKQDDVERTIYLFVNFHYKYGVRASDNEEVHEKLVKLTKHEF